LDAITITPPVGVGFTKRFIEFYTIALTDPLWVGIGESGSLLGTLGFQPPIYVTLSDPYVRVFQVVSVLRTI
jgi:hypothetical protein